jgi:hypothetical protein
MMWITARPVVTEAWTFVRDVLIPERKRT